MRKTGAINFNIPSGTEMETSTISSFKGLHITDNPLMTDQDSAADMKNVYLTLENTLSTRPRLSYKDEISDIKEMISYQPLSDDLVLYHYVALDDSIKVVVNDSTVTNGSLVGSNKISAFKKDDRIYILSDEGYFVIVNNELHSVVNDEKTYIPTTSTIIDGVEVPYEQENLLSNKYKKAISWNGEESLKKYLDNSTLDDNKYYVVKEIITDNTLYYTTSLLVKSKSKEGSYIILTKNSNDNLEYILVTKDSLINITTEFNITPTSASSSEIWLSNNGRYIVFSSNFRDFKLINLNTNTTFIFSSAYTTDSSYQRTVRDVAVSEDGKSVWITWTRSDSYTSCLETFYKNNSAYSSRAYDDLIGDSIAPLNIIEDSIYAKYRVGILPPPLTTYKLVKYDYDGLGIRVTDISTQTDITGGILIISDDLSGFISFFDNELSYYDLAGNLLRTMNIENYTQLSNTFNGKTFYFSKDRVLYQVDVVDGGVYPITKDYTSQNGWNIQAISNNNFLTFKEPNILKLYTYTDDLLPNITTIYEKELNYEHTDVYNWTSKTKNEFISSVTPSQITNIDLSEYDNVTKKITSISITPKNPNPVYGYLIVTEYGTYDDLNPPISVVYSQSSLSITNTSSSTLNYDIWIEYEENVLVERIYKIPLTYYKNFYNNYWFCYKNKLYNTKYNDPTYIPVDSVSILGNDDDITGMTLLTDSSMCVYKKDKQFIVYASTDSNGNVLYYNNEMKTDQGNLPKYQTLVTPINEYPLQFNDRGIFVLNIPKDINTDTNTATSVSEKVNPKFLAELNKEDILTHNHLYWTYVIFPRDIYSQIYVLDNRTMEWYYWEVPIKISGCREVYNVYDVLKDTDGETIGIYDHDSTWEKIIYDPATGEVIETYDQNDVDYYDSKFLTETEFITDDGVIYTFTTMDYFDDVTQLGTIYCDIMDSREPLITKPIDWLWESEITPLTYTKYYKSYPATGTGKQLYQTGFLFVDSDRTEDYQLNYQFTVFRKHMTDKNVKPLPSNTLNYIRSVVKRTRIPKFNFMKIRLTSPDDIAKNRLNLISLKFKYKLTQEVK